MVLVERLVPRVLPVFGCKAGADHAKTMGQLLQRSPMLQGLGKPDC